MCGARGAAAENFKPGGHANDVSGDDSPGEVSPDTQVEGTLEGLADMTELGVGPCSHVLAPLAALPSCSDDIWLDAGGSAVSTSVPALLVALAVSDAAEGVSGLAEGALLEILICTVSCSWIFRVWLDGL